MNREDLLGSVRAAVQADPVSDLKTGLAAAVIRFAVLGRGSVSRARLVPEITELLGPLGTEGSDLRELVEGELEALLAIGDLVTRQPAPGARTQIEPARSSFSVLQGTADSKILVLGGSIDGRPTLPSRLAAYLEPRGRTRWLAVPDITATTEDLRFSGLREIPFARWASVPPTESLDTLVAPLLEKRKVVSPDAIGNLEVLDPTSPNGYFRGRIRRASIETLRSLCERFRFVPARDPDAEAGMCYSLLSLRDGEVTLALIGSGVLARDVWLRIAAGLCRTRGPDAAFKCEREGNILRLFFPPPSWLERLLALGTPLDAGGLCSFQVPSVLWTSLEDSLRKVAFADLRNC